MTSDGGYSMVKDFSTDTVSFISSNYSSKGFVEIFQMNVKEPSHMDNSQIQKNVHICTRLLME